MTRPELGRDRQRGGPAGRDHGAVVVELELGQEPVGGQPPVLPRGPQGQAGARRGVDLLEPHRLDELGRRDPGLGQDPAEHDVLLGLGEDDLLLVAEPDDPGHDADVVEPRGAADAQDQQAGHEHQRLGQVHAVVAASPRRSEPRQAHRLPPSSVRMSRQNRQGWPSSHRIVGGSSSPSVRRSRSRPRPGQPLDDRRPGCAGGRTGGSPSVRVAPIARRPLARRRAEAAGSRFQQGQELAVLGVVLRVRGAGACHQGFSGPSRRRAGAGGGPGR